MENAVEDKFKLLVDKLKSNEENTETKFLNICGNGASTSVQSKYFQNTKPVAKDSQEKKEKSKISSVLDPYCETNVLNESDDFTFSQPVSKVKNGKNEYTNKSRKLEIISCEICKEDITQLDVYNRAVHVNNCIDKQTTVPPKPEVQSSATENVFILECPLCFKHFSSPELRSNHIKKCGKSKGLSLQSVIKALELQERHALERISLGLPAKPLKPAKPHKNTATRKAIVEPKNKGQSDIQLAKALSLSLTNSDQQSEEECKFVTLKPPLAHQYPGRKPKRVVTPVLVLRSEEERKKMLLEKVATIVTSQISGGDSPVDNECISQQKKDENPCLIPLLWQLCGKAMSKHEYYVESLLDWIQPSEVEAGAKLHHLSQIAGHEILTQLPCDYTFSNEHIKQENCSMFCDASPLIGSLCSLVASSWMSDVDIYTACGSIIPAHRLLLAVRCPPLKQDSDFCFKSGKVQLKWENTPFNVALKFLKFIYTDTIEMEESMTSDLLYLANKYEVSELQKLLLSNKDISMPSDIGPSEKMAEECSTKDSTSLHFSPPEDKHNPDLETEEDNNMDLEIVYNCINSSLKPSQISIHEHLNLSPATSCQPEFKNFSDSSPQKGPSPVTSPVIFDISDNENEVEMEVGSSDESVELPVNCSSKSVLQENNLDNIELDLCSTRSFSSQDSVKFLESSFPDLSKTPVKEKTSLVPSSPQFLESSFSNLSKTLTRGKTGLLSSSPQFLTSFCREESPPALVDNVSIDFQKSSCEINTCKKEALDFHKLVSGEDVYPESLAIKHFKRSFAQYEDKIDSDDEISVVGASVKCPTINSIFESEVPEEIHDNLSSTALSSQILLVSENPNNLSSSQKQFQSVEKTSACMSEVPALDYENDLNNSPTSFRIEGEISCEESSCQFSDELNVQHSLNSQGKNNAQNEDTSIFLHSPNGVSKANVVWSPKILHSTSVRKDIPFSEEKYEFSSTSLPYGEAGPCKPEIFSGSTPIPSKPHECDEFMEQGILSSTEQKLHSPKNTKFSKNPITESVTPSTSHLPQFRITDSPITPFPDYKNMVTPQIKEALRKIGVKALPRKKAIAVLSHVYNETHPLINEEMNAESCSEVKPKKKKQKTSTRQPVTQDSDDSGSENPQWQGCIPEISFSQFTQDSPTKSSKDEMDLIKQYILSNEELYNNILTYSPLNLVAFHQELKNNGIKMSIQKLMDFLDEQCITFTCPRKEEYKKKQTARAQRFRKNMIAKLSQQTT